ncbi:hypothetical protein QVD17_27946 [Tagetes erecta]|uniref:Uncharacterized protein n=1 Tax=Tagetes erecta TaxID=13708 RepID=A0AAD8K9Y4_TARER|nr:hypothetical protein QVD17_27946 [Tagetes erecta]
MSEQFKQLLVKQIIPIPLFHHHLLLLAARVSNTFTKPSSFSLTTNIFSTVFFLGNESLLHMTIKILN